MTDRIYEVYAGGVMGRLGRVTITEQNWRDTAACKGKPTQWWFSNKGDYLAVNRAKAICSECPVRSECLEYALKGSELMVGIWGGMSLSQRKRILRERKQQ